MTLFIKQTLIVGAIVLGASLGLACSTAPDVIEGEDQNITGTSCRIFNNQTGKPITPEELAKLDDPVAKKLLEGAGCPTTYTDALKKLKGNDSTGCKDAQGGSQADGLGTFLISETAAHASAAEAANDGFRTVTAKVCDGRQNDGLLFSAFANAGQASETSVEMIGKDATSGVYNYYEVLDGGQWVFYGNSFDFVGNGYDCKPSGFCVSQNSKKASSPSGKSCASCHVSGGLIMKELDSPWLHWTAGFPNGSKAVVDKSKDKLGNQMQGENLEINVVRPSFDPYNQKRTEFLATKGTAELLRPLFCTMDINLDSQFIGGSLLVDTSLSFGFLSGDQNAYNELKGEVRQRINGLPASVSDTNFPFTYPSRGQIDSSYVQTLQNAQLIDAEFAQDALNVDFTRPIFSGQRCGLLSTIQGKTAAIDAKLASFAKETDQGKKSALASEIAKDIPALFTTTLTAKSPRKPAEEKFLKNLTDAAADVAAHQKAAGDFFQKCNDRLSGGDAASKKAALKDIMTYASHVRSVMRKDVVGFNGQDLLEGGGRDNKMVTDDIPDNANALDPTDCTLTLAPTAVK